MNLLQRQVQELTGANSALSTKIEAQAQEIMRLTNESSTFVWKINGFNEILKQAKSRNCEEIFSEPFYTGKRGYKLRVCIQPDGDQTNKNRYLSVFIGIMKGNYDAILPWPFQHEVTFTLIDQQQDPVKRDNVVTSFTPDTKLHVCSFARPSTKQNEMRGFLRFVSHKNLKTRRYIVDDTLFLQVDIKPLSFDSGDE